MSTFPIYSLTDAQFPPLLSEIPQPPKSLWAMGTLPDHDMPLIAVVGSRQYTSYGAQAVEHLISGLRGYDIGIVSGLAIGIDTLAHEAALATGLYTLAVPGSGLDYSVLYPARNKRLADRILESGGGLLSELPPTSPAANWTFPARNRIMAGLCQATLLIEAGEKSGTLITARMAVDYNRELLVVPGNIFSNTSAGTHQFLKLGATPVTCAADILEVFGITSEQTDTPTLPMMDLSPLELTIVNYLTEPRDRDSLIRHTEAGVAAANMAIMKLELDGVIAQKNNIYVRLF